MKLNNQKDYCEWMIRWLEENTKRPEKYWELISWLQVVAQQEDSEQKIKFNSQNRKNCQSMRWQINANSPNNFFKNLLGAIYFVVYEVAVNELKNLDNSLLISHFIWLKSYSQYQNSLMEETVSDKEDESWTSDAEMMPGAKKGEYISKERISIKIPWDQKNLCKYLRDYSNFSKFISLIKDRITKEISEPILWIIEAIMTSDPQSSCEECEKKEWTKDNHYERNDALFSFFNTIIRAAWIITTEESSEFWLGNKDSSTNLIDNQSHKVKAKKEDLVLFLNTKDFKDLKKGIIRKIGRKTINANLDILRKDIGFIFPIQDMKLECARLIDRNSLKITPQIKGIDLSDPCNHFILIEFDVCLSQNFAGSFFSPSLLLGEEGGELFVTN